VKLHQDTLCGSCSTWQSSSLIFLLLLLQKLLPCSRPAAQRLQDTSQSFPLVLLQ
jgi:hypothetical protein